MRIRTLFFISASALAATFAEAQDEAADLAAEAAEAAEGYEEPDAAGEPAFDGAVREAETLAAPASAPTTAISAPAPNEIPDDAHGSAGGSPVGAADELDALNQGAEEEFPDIAEEPTRKPVSVTVRALDKITARYKDLTANIDESVRFGSLEITPRYCDKRPPEDFPETTAFLEVFDRDLSRARNAASVEVREPVAKKKKGAAKVQPVAAPVTAASDTPASLDPDRIFGGWMFASSPALNPLEHPVYDVWVIDCKTEAVGS